MSNSTMFVSDNSQKADRIALLDCIRDKSIIGKEAACKQYCKSAINSGIVTDCRMIDEYCGIITLEYVNPWNPSAKMTQEYKLHANIMSCSSNMIMIK